MAVKTKQQIIDDATTFIPDNTNHEVSPADIRQRIIDVVDSASFTSELPNLATVATTGSYNDLTNKPTYATVANTGSYNDLTNKPTIIAGTGLQGGGTLSANVTVSLSTATQTSLAKADDALPRNGSQSMSGDLTIQKGANGAGINLVGDGVKQIYMSDNAYGNEALIYSNPADGKFVVRPYATDNTTYKEFAFDPVSGDFTLPNNPVGPLAATTKQFVETFSTGYRNKIINGDFDVWQRGSSQTTAGYKSDDRWINYHLGATGSFSHTIGTFSPGQTVVPGNPQYYSSTTVTHAVAAGNGHVKEQRIENLFQFSGRWVTITFYAKADSNKNIAVELSQNYGTGGSPSATVSMPIGLFALTTSWQKITIYTQIPSMSGKTFGTNNEHNLGVLVWFDAGSNFNTRASGIGQQSGVFDIAHFSLVFDDATSETDPFSPRHPQQEFALCQRYYTTQNHVWLVASGPDLGYFGGSIYFPVQMRNAPAISFTDTVGNPSKVTTSLSGANQTIAGGGINQFSNDRMFRVDAVMSAAINSWVGFIYTADAEL